MKFFSTKLSFQCTCLLLVLCFSCYAKLRWSSLHLIPDADLIDDAEIVADLNAFYFPDDSAGSTFRPCGTVTYGISNWVNVRAGYAGGLTLGLKARILNETNVWLPSLAIGIHNIATGIDVHYFDKINKNYTNELYFSLGKSVEPIRLRFHCGIQSIPNNKRERFNPYIGIEKYFGGGVYTSVEVARRDYTFYPSLFTSWRFLKNRIELSAGIIGITQLLLDENDEVDMSLVSTSDEFIRPGIFFGIRFHGVVSRLGRNEGYQSVDDQLRENTLAIDTLRKQVDSLRSVLLKSTKQIKSFDSSVSALADSTLKSKDHYRRIALEKLNSIRVFYQQEPFEPELVKQGMSQIAGFRNEIVPALVEIVYDQNLDKKIRSIAVSVLGEIATGKAIDALIDILGQSKEAGIKIEALINLGKNKETRAIYLIQQLTNDSDDALSFTASEVLQKITQETGIKLNATNAQKKVQEKIPEKKIGERDISVIPKETTIPKSDKSGQPADSLSGLKKQ